MSEAVERMMRRMWDASEQGIPPFNRRPFEACPPLHRMMLEVMARGALEALREPTEAMKRAGDESGWFVTSDEDTRDHSREAVAVWQAMLDAAINGE